MFPISAIEVLILAFAILLGVLRVMGIKHKSFQAVAHIFVGGLFGAWLVSHDVFLLVIAVALSVLELICFLLLK